MIEQEAIRIIRYRIDTARAVCGSGKDGKAFEDLEMAIEALNKQIPKKPIVKYNGTHDCVTEVEWECPVCGIEYIELTPCNEWCPHCGNRIDWSDNL